MRIAFAFPGALLTVFSAAALAGSLFDAHPFWPEPEPPLTLSEHVVARGQADVVRMILLGEDPNTRHEIRSRLFAKDALRLTPLEAAVAANDPSMVRTLLAYGAFVDAPTWNLLHCAARSEEIRETLRAYGPAESGVRCEDVKRPW